MWEYDLLGTGTDKLLVEILGIAVLELLHRVNTRRLEQVWDK